MVMKKIYFVIIAVLLISNISGFAQNVAFDVDNFRGKEADFYKARSDYKKGNKYFDMGKTMYVTALKHFLDANNFNPNCADLNLKIGLCYLKTVQKPKSIAYFEKAISLDAKIDPKIKYYIAQAYHLNLEFDKAITFFQDYKATLSPSEIAEEGKDIDKRIAECRTAKEIIKTPARVFIDNLGSTVNSIYSEYSPLINVDESRLFFTSRRPDTYGGKKDPNDQEYYEDIYITDNKSGNWTTPVNPPKPLNSKKHDATVGLSADGQTLLIYKGTNGGDIYECHLDGDSWTKPKKLSSNINTPFHESSASLSFDGKVLYFVSDREGGFGGSDIWMSTKDKRGKWGTAVNLGAGINTLYDEEGVFLHPSGKTLYFSSKGHSTMGGYDIFKTIYENGRWIEPVNLGYPINSADDDVFFSISGNELHGYYASDKPEGYGRLDLYLITFLGPEKPLINNTEDNLIASQTQPVSDKVIEPVIEIKQNQLTLLKGVVVDDITSEPLGAILEIMDNEKNEVIANFESNKKTGKYLISLPSGKNYGLAVKCEGYLFYSDNFNIPASTQYREIVKDIRLQKLAVGSKIVLNNIFFDFNKATLRPESTAELDRLVKLMNENPTLKIELSGHTDNKGTAAYNKKLSEERAKSVYDFCISKGVSKDRLTYVGYGFDKPIATNDTEEGRQLNRRTEMKVLSK
jgi:outer membrane protein OmpA-like peptidoglycan-associated protein/tetratricopeptide (TPR) repeat protein